MNRQFEDIMLGSIELFCLAADKLNFTAAATVAGLTPAAVSRSISRLENRLGVQLFVRTTRQIRLSDAGQIYFEKCRQMLGELAEAERAVAGSQLAPSGVVRMSLPTPYGQYRVLPLLPKFHALYPQVSVEVQLSNRNIDFVNEEFDLAIRGRNPPDSGLVARKLEDVDLIVVGAPSYLKAAGIPQTPAQLKDHECIQFVLPSSGQNVAWLFREGGQDYELMTHGHFSFLEEILGGVTLAKHGAGLVQTLRFIVEEDLQKGTLQEVLPDYSVCTRTFSLLYQKRSHMPLRMRLLIDFLMLELTGRAAA